MNFASGVYKPASMEKQKQSPEFSKNHGWVSSQKQFPSQKETQFIFLQDVLVMRGCFRASNAGAVQRRLPFLKKREEPQVCSCISVFRFSFVVENSSKNFMSPLPN